MQQVLEQMLRSYEPQTSTDKKNAIKEIIQEIVLCGLSRAGFFKHAAFYGGTALRIFYGLDRFSEDLDFSLMAPESFDLGEYLPLLEKEIHSYGLKESNYCNENFSIYTIVAFLLFYDIFEQRIYSISDNSFDQMLRAESVNIPCNISQDISLDNIQWKSEIRLFIFKFRPENIRACPKKARSYIILSTIQVFFDVKYSCESQKSQKLGLFDYTLHYTLHKNVDI